MMKEEAKKPKRENEAIKLLLPKGTYARLQTVAEKQGSKASVMCHKERAKVWDKKSDTLTAGELNFLDRIAKRADNDF
jgi:hypothetical protein